jgi:hypothetical protein
MIVCVPLDMRVATRHIGAYTLFWRNGASIVRVDP